MAMNDAELAAVASELERRVGLSASGLWQPSRDRVVLGLGDRTFLLMVPRGPLARVHTITRRPKNPPRPFSFQGACRAHLRGALLSVTKVADDRVLRLTFATGALELRLTGRRGGLWLLGPEGAVIAAYDGPAPHALPVLPPRPVRDDEIRFAPVDGSYDLGARRFFAQLERAQRAKERRSSLERRLKRSIQRAQRLLENLEQDLERAEQAPELRHAADLLASNLHRVERGAHTVQVDDWNTGESIELTLDPSRPASEQLEQLYRRASRLDRVGDRVLERLDATERELAELHRALRDLPHADLETLEALDQRLPALSTGSRGPAAVHRPWTCWVGPHGQRVLVGRNERGNRKLTFQVARGSDWWMHLRERPGAHLILPTAKDQVPSLDHLLAAAQIALIHGKVPEGDAADVQYARIRDVRAIPGELARVQVADERVLRVTRDAAELVGWIREDDAPG